MPWDGLEKPEEFRDLFVNNSVSVELSHSVDLQSYISRPPHPPAPQACWALESHTDELARAVGLDPVAFRKLNVGGWDSPLAQRWLKDVAELPLVVVLGPDGAERARFTGVKLDALDAVLGAPAP